MQSVNKEVATAWDFLTGPELWIKLGGSALKIIIIMILASILIKVSKKIIDHLFHNHKKGPLRISERRESTIKKLIQNIITYVVYFTAFTMVLDTLTIKVGPLLAGAGVAGLAIGFGAQSLVKDVISGFFIIFEDQFGVGDYVSTSGVEGTVEEIGLRTTKIQSWTGELNVIPNGNIDQVTNYSIYNGRAVVDVNIPYESNMAKAEQVIDEVVKGLPDKYEEILSVPEVIGVQTLEVSHYVVRVIADTLPVYQWAGARMIRKEIQERLYSEGIEIPSPRLVMYSRSDEKAKVEPVPEPLRGRE
ncbi:mechanosensitive ion channel family protein [Aciduricibacillus chroicocephali]|uniref:Mechanosensitive ion channel family protein n=1 Tax=Aciduricibacillus chroicocephali TaxID=3054939 RepID=A0ABY9KVA3_9BACI|nr:mechanosensitive ion channel family protein [Bacillaceae bacterium 44XB]